MTSAAVVTISSRRPAICTRPPPDSRIRRPEEEAADVETVRPAEVTVCDVPPLVGEAGRSDDELADVARSADEADEPSGAKRSLSVSL